MGEIMPPHCDTLDGPVVTAARRALEQRDVDLVLPWVHPGGEAEVRSAFREASKVRQAGGDASKLADRWFFENVVRIHREGEGAAYAGLKPAGMDVGPVLPLAERAIAAGDAAALAGFLGDRLREQIEARLKRVRETQALDGTGVAAARQHVNAVLDLELYSHHLYELIVSGAGHGSAASEQRAQEHERLHA